MLKTLLFTSDYPPARGGVARYLSGLARYFGDRVSVVVPGEGERRWWSAARWFIRHRGEYDQICVSHALPFGTAAFAARFITRKPYVVIVHGMDVRSARRRLGKEFVLRVVLAGAKMAVANSKALEREIRVELGARRTMVVYPPVDPVLTGAERRAASDGIFRLLTVARLVPRKGHLRVLEALARVQSTYGLPITYTIVGDGSLRESIEATAKELGVSVRIEMGVTDDNLSNAYANADAFVMPVSDEPVDREGFGTVYVEAAAHGLPSIATNMPGVDEAVIHGQTGLLVPNGDIAALAEAVYRLATELGLRERLGEAAKRRAQEEFTPERQFSKLNGIL